jgi:hypothetical protein
MHFWIGYLIGLGFEPKFSLTKVQNYMGNLCEKTLDHHITSPDHPKANGLVKWMV